MTSGFVVPPPPTWDGQTPRGPATEAEALAMVQRSFAAGLGRRRDGGAGAPIELPDRVPAADEARQMGAFRLDPEVYAYAKARASLDDLTLSRVLDRLLRQYAAAPPRSWPTNWGPPGARTILDPRLPGN